MKINSHREQSQPISKETTPSKEGDFKGPGAWERPSQDKERNKWFLDGVAWATMPISVPDSTVAMAMMIRNNAELNKADSCFSLLPKSFPLSDSMLLFPEDEISHSQDQSLFVGKVKCLRPTSVIPLPLPLVSPAQSAKHTQASQPLGSHGGKKHFPLLFQESMLTNWTVVI